MKQLTPLTVSLYAVQVPTESVFPHVETIFHDQFQWDIYLFRFDWKRKKRKSFFF